MVRPADSCVKCVKQGAGAGCARTWPRPQPRLVTAAWRGREMTESAGLRISGNVSSMPVMRMIRSSAGRAAVSFERAAGTPRVPGDPGEHAEARRVAEGQLGRGSSVTGPSWLSTTSRRYAYAWSAVAMSSSPRTRTVALPSVVTWYASSSCSACGEVDDCPHVRYRSPCQAQPGPLRHGSRVSSKFPLLDRSERKAPSAPTSSNFVLSAPGCSSDSEDREPDGCTALSLNKTYEGAGWFSRSSCDCSSRNVVKRRTVTMRSRKVRSITVQRPGNRHADAGPRHSATACTRASCQLRTIVRQLARPLDVR